MIVDVGDKNGQNRHQHFIVVTNTVRLQDSSPTSREQRTSFDLIKPFCELELSLDELYRRNTLEINRKTQSLNVYEYL